VRERDLAGLQTGLVDDVALGGQVKPDGNVRVFIVVEEVALARLFSLLLGSLLDVCQKGL
jgi:hypothetical protein